jgi:hypothetical protein
MTATYVGILCELLNCRRHLLTLKTKAKKIRSQDRNFRARGLVGKYNWRIQSVQISTTWSQVEGTNKAGLLS